ncbi:MAG: hypothetical protein HY769_07595 [Candidatus Stahlbacteria bacterium]|nr:hypothetical protein [Candidatus Stahlbacteria bacterium]
MWILFIVASVGFKMLDNSQMLAYGMSAQNNYFLISQLDTGDKINTSLVSQKKSDLSWIITEPLGGVLGGGIGGLLGAGMGASLAMLILGEDFAGIYGACQGMKIGYGLGNGVGIWAVGKYVEKEKGSLLLTVLGSSAGLAIGWVTDDDLGAYLNGFGIWGLPIICGLIAYRLSLKLNGRIL